MGLPSCHEFCKTYPDLVLLRREKCVSCYCQKAEFMPLLPALSSVITVVAKRNCLKVEKHTEEIVKDCTEAAEVEYLILVLTAPCVDLSVVC